MKNKLLFLEEKDFISTAYYMDKKEEIYSVRSEVNQLANKHLFSVSEYRKLIRKKTDLKNKIPIYFSESLLLFYLKDDITIYWINYFNILKICYEDSIYIIFKNGDILRVKVSKELIKKELMKVEKVLNYIRNLYL